MAQCTATSKRTHERCRDHAMRGKRVCYHHGGKAGRPMIHGRYSKALEKHPDVLAYYEGNRDDPNLMETLNEVAMLRAKLQHYMDAFGSDRQPRTMQSVLQYGDAISKLVERRHKMLYGEQITISIRHYQALVAQLIEAVREIYGDTDGRFAQFLDRAERSLSSGADPTSP